MPSKADRKADRYQHQPWYVKLWRRRHYIPIPLVALRIYWAGRKVRADEPAFRIALSIAIGLAQVKMNWLHDWSEIRERLGKGKTP